MSFIILNNDWEQDREQSGELSQNKYCASETHNRNKNCMLCYESVLWWYKERKNRHCRLVPSVNPVFFLRLNTTLQHLTVKLTALSWQTGVRFLDPWRMTFTYSFKLFSTCQSSRVSPHTEELVKKRILQDTCVNWGLHPFDI